MSIFKLLFSCIISLVFIMESCGIDILWGVGTHGMIKKYHYSVSKDSLLRVIDKVLETSTVITKEKSENTDYIKILVHAETDYSFVFRFYEDDAYNAAHPTRSEIFITGIKKGNGEYKKEKDISNREKKEGLEIFERYFISEMNKIVPMSPPEKP